MALSEGIPTQRRDGLFTEKSTTKKTHPRTDGFKVCPGPGSNRHGHYCPQDFKSGVSTNSTTGAPTKNPPVEEGLRAKDGIRTRDPDLGKVVLYQLSYFRVRDGKYTAVIITCNSACYFFETFSLSVCRSIKASMGLSSSKFNPMSSSATSSSSGRSKEKKFSWPLSATPSD
jgi:hypothetical protein